MLSCVAVLSDIHGVLPALEAVLAEPDVRLADRIVLTGDIAAGPQPVETLDRLVALGDRVTWVRGNADRELVDIARGAPAAYAIDGWAARQLRADQVELLASLPHPVTLKVAGFGPVLCCHGSPRDDDEVLLVDTRMARWQAAFAEVPEVVRTVVCGHTHMPFARLVDGRLVINAGSVGMPYGGRGPRWALLADGEARLRRSELDAEAAAQQVCSSSGFPGVDAWVQEYLTSSSSDVAALAAFGPRDGRAG